MVPCSEKNPSDSPNHQKTLQSLRVWLPKTGHNRPDHPVGREGLGLAEGGLRGRPRRVAATPCTSRPLVPLKETVRRREKLQKRGQVGRASPPSGGPCLTRTVIMESSTFFVFRFVSEKSEIPPHARDLPRTSVTRQFWDLCGASPGRTRGFCARALRLRSKKSYARRPPTEARRPEATELKPTPTQQQRQR